MDGILSAPGEFTTTAGGGADKDAAATWKLAGGRLTSMTDGPEMSLGFTTAARGITLASCMGGCNTGAGRGAPGTPLARPLKGVAGPRASPYLHSHRPDVVEARAAYEPALHQPCELNHH